MSVFSFFQKYQIIMSRRRRCNTYLFIHYYQSSLTLSKRGRVYTVYSRHYVYIIFFPPLLFITCYYRKKLL